MPGIPTNAPNYSTVRALSAWWLETPPTGARQVVATTGYGFVKALQQNLSDLFAGWPPLARAYSGTIGGLGSVFVSDPPRDGNWSHSTSAALWYWLKTKKDGLNASVGDAATTTYANSLQHAMDVIERFEGEHQASGPSSNVFVPLEALLAAIWLVHYRDQRFDYVLSHVSASGGPGPFPEAPIFPPYNREAAPVPEASAQLFTVWNPDTGAHGMSLTTKIAIGVGVAAAIGAVWYLADKKRKASHALPGESYRDNPYAVVMSGWDRQGNPRTLALPYTSRAQAERIAAHYDRSGDPSLSSVEVVST